MPSSSAFCKGWEDGAAIVISCLGAKEVLGEIAELGWAS